MIPQLDQWCVSPWSRMVMAAGRAAQRRRAFYEATRTYTTCIVLYYM